MKPKNINRFAKIAVIGFSCCLLAITGCQPQNRSAANGGGLFGFGNRPLNPSSAFGATPNPNAGSGIAFNNPFQSGPATFNSTNTAFNQDFNSAAGNNSFASNPMAGTGQEFARINQQLGAFDADNQLLNTEVATLQQKLELANQYNQTLKQQLADTSDRINRTGNQERINAQQYASMQQRIEQLNQRIAEQDRMLAQSSNMNSQGNFQNTGFRSSNDSFQNSSFDRGGKTGSATLRANNGLMQKLSTIQIPGGNARMDGDIIRIEIPTDRLFTSESFRIQPAQLPMLQNITSTIRQSFPRQIVVIEAHWDGTPLGPPVQSDHQLTATQSLAVFDELVRLGLPKRQMMTMGMGSNRPRHRQQNVGGISPNRRIELVIYPETYDAN